MWQSRPIRPAARGSERSSSRAESLMSFEAVARFHLNPDGLRCEIAFPLSPGESTLQTDAPAVFPSLSPRKG